MEKVSQFLDVGKEHSWCIALSSRHRRKVSRHRSGRRCFRAHPQACDRRRESRSATRSCLSARTRQSISRRKVSDKSVVRNVLFFQIWSGIFRVRCTCFSVPKKKRDAEEQFVCVETMTNTTLTKATGQFEQMVIRYWSISRRLRRSTR